MILSNFLLVLKFLLKRFFPSTKKFVNLQNHKLNIKYKNDSLTISGNGNIKIDKNYDEINYFVLNDKEKTNFDFMYKNFK